MNMEGIEVETPPSSDQYDPSNTTHGSGERSNADSASTNKTDPKGSQTERSASSAASIGTKDTEQLQYQYWCVTYEEGVPWYRWGCLNGIPGVRADKSFSFWIPVPGGYEWKKAIKCRMFKQLRDYLQYVRSFAAGMNSSTLFDPVIETFLAECKEEKDMPGYKVVDSPTTVLPEPGDLAS